MHHVNERGWGGGGPTKRGWGGGVLLKGGGEEGSY